MKSLQEITLSILHDCGMACGANTQRDSETITRRVEDEGESFLTITLPTFSAGLEEALKEGRWSPAHAPAFKRGRRGLPRFLGGFLDQVFDAEGCLLPESEMQVRAIRAVRQICRAVVKLYVPCTDARVKKALVRFKEVEKELRNHAPFGPLRDTFNRVSRLVWSDLFRSSDSSRYFGDLRPRHGSGTTAEGITGNDKYHFRQWPQRLEGAFPFAEFGIGSILNPAGEALISSVTYTPPREELPVKVTPVPKTAKTPRIIAIEPVAMQFMQQALSDWLRPRIEHRGKFTAGRVNFSDQTVNNQLARSASLSGDLATLDMSDASDRVSAVLVRDMLAVVPFFMRDVFACRSTRAKLPTGEIVHLRKFASMGSALCFPMEAMAFFIAIVSSRLYRRGKRPTPRATYELSRDVYVYGDDLIVPADEAPSVIADLELFGFKVNTAKSFWTGKFRESCGGDYYNGIDVTPVYVRRNLPRHRADVHGIVSAVSLANQLYWAGYWKTARMVRESVEQLLGELPSVFRDDQVLGWESFSNARSHQAWDNDLHKPIIRGYVVVPRRRVDVLDDDAALLKCFRLIGSQANDSEHLRASVRYGNLALKRRWT